MAEIVEYETIAAEQKSEEQLRELERRVLRLEAQPAVPEPERGKMQSEVELVEQEAKANRAYVNERVSKANQRRAQLAEDLPEPIK